MIKLKCKEVVEAVGGSLIKGNPDSIIDSISTDSRKIKEGDFFIPIKGEKYDAHDFIDEVLKHNVAGILTQKDIITKKDIVIIKVNDTKEAMADLASYVRNKKNIPIVGITGSVGKTSTKDMISIVLDQKYLTLKTDGNFNNEIGVPLTLFNLEETHQAAVIEMGMSGFGEISKLTRIVRPDYAIITNIGLSHIEKLGSRTNILKAKMEIFEGLRENGKIILNGDEPLLYGLKNLLKFKTIFYGMEDGLDYQAYNVVSHGENGVEFQINVEGKEYNVYIPVPGIHNVYNALAAIAVGREENIPMEKIIEAIKRYISGKMRMNIIHKNEIVIINDTYNASPQSVKAALDVLLDIGEKRRKIAVLGDMLEMGQFAQPAHQEIGNYAANNGIDILLCIGENAQHMCRGALEAGMSQEEAIYFEDADSLKMFLNKNVKSGDVVLVKGSRGMKMEQYVDELTK